MIHYHPNTLVYKVAENKDGILLLVLIGFANDPAVTTCFMAAAERIIYAIQRRYGEIGLRIDPLKSSAFVTFDGKLKQLFPKIRGQE